MNLHDALSEPPAARASGRGLVEGTAKRLVRHAARHAPPALSERLEEEWLADLSGRHGAIPRLSFALGCCWATRVIAHELGVPVRAAAATAERAAAVCADPGRSFFSRRTMIFVLIGSLHTLLIYGLAAGMARKVLDVLPDRIQVALVPRATTPQEPPPQTAHVKLQKFQVAVPSWHRDSLVEPDAVTISTVEPQPPTVTTESHAKPVNRVVGGPGAGFPSTGDYYPDAARRMGETGAATVQVCVDRAGRLTADPVIAQSSGSARLDEGARKLARAGSGHYRATTEEGRPVNDCYGFRIRFDLKD